MTIPLEAGRSGDGRRGDRRSPVPVLAGAVVVGAMLTLPAPSSAQLYLAAGQGLYASDAYCLGPSAFLSTFRLGWIGSGFGASVSYAREDWPWWEPPPELLGQAAFRHGDAVQAVAEAYPLRLLAPAAGELAEYLQPFVGAGLWLSGDGDPAPTGGPGGVPVYGVRGSLDPLATVGASVLVLPADLPLGLVIQYRFTALFGADVEYESPTGGIERRDGSQTVTWSEVTAGFTIPLGE